MTSWPLGSLNKQLKDSGARNLQEAVDKKRNALKTKEAPQVTSQGEFYETMSQAIKDIEFELGSLDIDCLDKGLREGLAKMPLTTLKEIREWREAWIKVLRGRSWDPTS